MSEKLISPQTDDELLFWDWIAAEAANVLVDAQLSDIDDELSFDGAAKIAFNYADAFLAERRRRQDRP